MSFSQWKTLNQIRDYVAKLNDKSSHSVVHKELQNVLQKIPGLYSIHVFRNLKHEGKEPAENSIAKSEPQKANYALPQVFDSIKSKVIKAKEENTQLMPKWKTPNEVISKSSISSRTRHVISSIATAETEVSVLKRVDDLSSHIKQYPEARHHAVKEGAVHLLLRMRAKWKGKEVQASVREAFALLGYTDPLPRRGIRVLSIDGGGIRGLLVLEMLKKLEELTGKRVYEMFDFFCGVSTGAILVYSIGIQRRSLEEISAGYKELSMQVFKQSPLWGTSSLVWSHSYYDTSLWEKLLKEHLGDEILIRTSRDPNCPKLCTVSAVVNQSRLTAYLFRNYSLPWNVQSYYMGGSDHQVWQAARASAAAPTYFEEFKLGNLLHQDGGILVNNPTAIGLHEAKLLWPGSPVQCVVSFGTGRTVPSPADVAKETVSLNNTSWANKFLKILDSATDTEAVHTMLNDLLPDNAYYRFNPYLTEMLSMVETDQNKIEVLERDALMYLRRNEDKFREAAKALLQERTIGQKVSDFVKSKCDLYGISSFR